MPDRIERSVLSISWIPSEAVTGLPKVPFELGITHYDDPPPDVVEDLEGLFAAGAFRFANRLRAWVDVADGRVVDAGHTGGSYVSSTHVRLAGLNVNFMPTEFPLIQPPPEVSATSARFEQTAGGRPGVPSPRRVTGGAFMKWAGPNVWTTLALTINADGSHDYALAGASGFPRHWVYDDAGRLVQKSGVIDFEAWYRTTYGSHSPWGDEHSEALAVAAETALERQLSTTIMRAGARPAMREVPAGETLLEQGAPGAELFLLLDGVLSVEVDGVEVAQLGPGAVLGERAVLEGGSRTSTIRAVTRAKVAVATAANIDREALAALAAGHHREDR